MISQLPKKQKINNVNSSIITYTGAPVGIGTWEQVPTKFVQVH